jgi:hypothetical protein
MKSSSLWSIAYHSVMKGKLSDAEFADLALRAQARNRTLGIDGVLLFSGRHFFQILEGCHGFVNELYADIVADTRHRHITKILDGPIAARAFGDWHMRLITITDILRTERKIVRDALQILEKRDASGPDALNLAYLRVCSIALNQGTIRTPRPDLRVAAHA